MNRQNTDIRSILVVWLPLIVGSVFIAVVFRLGPGPHGPMRIVGLVLALIGFAGVIVSRYTLGRSFSITPQARALVTTGIYSRIRNPIYVFGMFFVGGLVLVIRRTDLFLLFVLLIPVQIVRARREAAVLEAKFGDTYRDYRKRTWF